MQAARRYRAKHPQVIVRNRERQRQFRADNPKQAKQIARDYYLKNKERLKPIRKAWAEKNKRKLAEYQRQWQADNRSKCVAYAKAWVARNPERAAEIWKSWDAKHPEKRRQIGASFRKRHPEVGIRSNVIRRLRVGDLKKYDALIDRMVREVAALEMVCCSYCKKVIIGKYHFDHVVPIARGGKHVRENLVVACVSCNLSKGPKLLTEWKGGIYAG